MYALQSDFFVRVGALGQVGRFRAADGQVYRRGTNVICRTGRGLETGVVLSPTSGNLAGESSKSDASDGSIVRRQTVEDQLLLSRLEKDRHGAFDACVELLAKYNLKATLMDVEHLFDGRSLYFYFMGEVPAEVESLTQQLADTYDAQVQFRDFSEAVEQGCGPDCGTDEAGGCGTNCGSCAIAAACNR